MKTKMDNIKTLQDMQQRKQELQAKIDMQKAEMMGLVKEVQDSLTPKNIVSSAVNGFLSSSNAMNFATPTVLNTASTFSQFFLKDNRKANMVRVALPILLALTPKLLPIIKEHLPSKDNISHFFNGLVARVKNVVS
jgi:hypothetical protein